MNIMIIGAGKIARGFIGHLLWKSHLPFIFVDANQTLTNLLNKNQNYTVRFLGEQIRTENITGFSVLCSKEDEKVIYLIATEINTIFISVGGKNLQSVGQLIRKGLLLRFSKKILKPINIILCENWIKPANIIYEEVIKNASEEFEEFFGTYVGITESVIMRSAIEPQTEILLQEPLTVNIQDFWSFPIDKSRLKGALPFIEGVEYLNDFNGYLDKKFYTYNAANGTVSYLGHLKEYKYISEAAHDPEILEVLMKVYEETGKALCEKHGFRYDEHIAFTKTSLDKLQNNFLVDYVERNARDPIRKLGPIDRLIGPARLVVKYGGVPEGLATSIAAAIYYDEPADLFSVKLKEIRMEKGASYILDTICQLKPEEAELKALVLKKIDVLKKKGWIKDNRF